MTIQVYGVFLLLILSVFTSFMKYPLEKHYPKVYNALCILIILVAAIVLIATALN